MVLSAATVQNLFTKGVKKKPAATLDQQKKGEPTVLLRQLPTERAISVHRHGRNLTGMIEANDPFRLSEEEIP
jgi:hypothetical protein